VELVKPELTPLAEGEHLDALIAAVSEHRGLSLTRDQARDARRLAREALKVGWDRGLIVAGLVATRAFTTPAFTYAIDEIRRRAGGDQLPLPVDRMNSAERSSEVVRQAIEGNE
jgi:hypothetical protein